MHTTPETSTHKTPKLTPTQAKIVKAKIKAEINDIPQAVVATGVFPNATAASASVMMSRELNKVNVQEALQIALAEHNLTADRIASVLDEALGATKTVIIRDASAKSPEEAANSAFADEVPDHGIRLKAAGMAGKFLGFESGEKPPAGNTFIFNTERTRKYIDA